MQEKHKLQVVLHQDKKKTQGGVKLRERKQRRRLGPPKKHTHKACTCEKRNTRGSSKREETQKAITSQFIHCSQLQEDINLEKKRLEGQETILKNTMRLGGPQTSKRVSPT